MEDKKLQAIRDFIVSSEKSLKNAKKLLWEVLKDRDITVEDINLDTDGLTSYASDDSKIIEWVFTGEEMLGSDSHKYPVPANYASKSKMVQWDKLKLTILPSGKMLYKQIAPIDRETKVGLLTKDLWKFQVVADGKAYDVLTAAVTHFKWEIGDSVTVLVPKDKEATYAAIETVIPKEG